MPPVKAEYILILASAVLFAVLSPGVLVTIPPTSNCSMFIQLKKNRYCASSYGAVAVHTIVFAVLLYVFLEFSKSRYGRRLLG